MSALRIKGLSLAAAIALAFGLVATHSFAAEGVAIPPPAVDERSGSGIETITLAGGCFWGVQGVFQHVEGVTSAVSGYAGGERNTASYDKVSTGDTGHAEAVRVTFDRSKVSLGRILQVYFSVAHDPTTSNRQGPDRGTQYRSEIFASSAEQAKIAKAYIGQLDRARVYGAPIVTRIGQGGFFPAEAHHQDYMTLNPRNPYIATYDAPKVVALQKLMPELYRSRPVLVASSSTN